MFTRKKLFWMAGVILAIAIVALVLGALGLRERSNMMTDWNDRWEKRMMQLQNNGSSSDSVIPFGATKTGEITMLVNNFDFSKQMILQIANANNAVVYATATNMAWENLKHGYVVLQFPLQNFDRIFADLESAGFTVISEKTQRGSGNGVYPMMQPVPAGTDSAPSAAGDVAAGSGSESPAGPAVSSLEAPGGAGPQNAIYPQPTSNFAYIKVNLAENGQNRFSASFGQYPFHLLASLIAKIVLLMILLGLMIFMLKRIFHAFHLHHEYIKHKRGTKSAVMNRKRVIRIAKKK